MGMEYQVYIGAFADIVAAPVTKNAGVQCPDGHARNSLFCPKCGKGMVPMTKEYPAGLYDLLPEDEFVDVFYQPNIDGRLIIIGNSAIDGKDRVGWFDAVPIARQITGDGQDFIEAFKEEYRPELEILEARAESVTIKFGIIGWWM